MSEPKCSFCGATKSKETPIIVSDRNAKAGICYKCVKEKREELNKPTFL